MSDAVVRYRVLEMRQPDFVPALLPCHAAFLADLREKGLLALAGGFDDCSGGAHLLRGVADLAAAEAIAAADPLVVHGASTAHVHGWRTH